MVLEHRNRHRLRGTFTLSFGLTALFLFVRCAVPERDYSLLGIGRDGEGGAAGNDGVLHSTAGSAGSAGQGNYGGGDGEGDAGLGGSGGAPPAPIPCTNYGNGSKDAGTGDAGSGDAGSGDAGSGDAGSGDAGISDAGGALDASTGGEEEDPLGPFCACVDGFARAIDADGDGVGTRACSIAPGLDCDDGDGTVTHNECGGCSELTETIGADCLECGAYACAGPDTVVCASKPEPLVDPDCRCVDGVVAARDTDKDGAGTRLCEQAPGTDCNDGDPTYVTNACGGCDELPGAVGADCGVCGTFTCLGGALACTPKTGTAGSRCVGNTRQTCVGTGFWGNDTECPYFCYQNACQVCQLNTYQCGTVNGYPVLYKCDYSSAYGGIGWISQFSCASTQTCNAVTRQCVGALFLPRDKTFDVVPLLRPGLPWHDILNTASESDYG